MLFHFICIYILFGLLQKVDEQADGQTSRRSQVAIVPLRPLWEKDNDEYICMLSVAYIYSYIYSIHTTHIRIPEETVAPMSHHANVPLLLSRRDFEIYLRHFPGNKLHSKRVNLIEFIFAIAHMLG